MHSGIFYDPSRENRFFTKKKRKITTVKWSTGIVVEESRPTDYTEEFEDVVRSTILPFTFLLLSTVLSTETSILTGSSGAMTISHSSRAAPPSLATATVHRTNLSSKHQPKLYSTVLRNRK